MPTIPKALVTRVGKVCLDSIHYVFQIIFVLLGSCIVHLLPMITEAVYVVFMHNLVQVTGVKLDLYILIIASIRNICRWLFLHRGSSHTNMILRRFSYKVAYHIIISYLSTARRMKRTMGSTTSRIVMNQCRFFSSKFFQDRTRNFDRILFI